jgi:hypothetical protein
MNLVFCLLNEDKSLHPLSEGRAQGQPDLSRGVLRAVCTGTGGAKDVAPTHYILAVCRSDRRMIRMCRKSSLRQWRFGSGIDSIRKQPSRLSGKSKLLCIAWS